MFTERSLTGATLWSEHSTHSKRRHVLGAERVAPQLHFQGTLSCPACLAGLSFFLAISYWSFKL